MTVAIIGCGFTGNALKVWLERRNPEIKILISDPAIGYFDDVYNREARVDAYFVQIHVPTLADGTQDIESLVNIIRDIPEGIPVWVRTTISLMTFKKLTKINPSVQFLPEFLTQRTSVEDFEKQMMIFTGNTDLLKKIFSGKRFIEMTSEEAILAKYAHNVFGALKVTYFNCVSQMCKSRNLNCSKVLSGVLASGYINEEHTHVPGPDGKCGYGGKCFPKDVMAFSHECQHDEMFKLVGKLQEINHVFRNEE